jgi:hypothetical protein
VDAGASLLRGVDAAGPQDPELASELAEEKAELAESEAPG